MKPVPKDPGEESPFAKKKLGVKRPAKRIQWPGDEFSVDLWNPSDDEITQASAEATRYLKDELRLDEFQVALAVESNIYKAEEQRQLLVQVLRDPEDNERPFTTLDDLRSPWFNPDVRAALMRHLAAYIDERSPQKKVDGDWRKVAGMISDLKAEGALLDYLMSCGFDSLVSIVTSLAEALPKPTAPSSSNTST